MKNLCFIFGFCFFSISCQTSLNKRLEVENLFPEGPDVSNASLMVPYSAPMQTQPLLFELIPEAPEAMQGSVQKWLDYFQGRGRKYMSLYLERSGRYTTMMTTLLKEAGLPEDLIYVVFIESGFSGQARSHVAATGYWQFMKKTGHYYDLKINRYVDERRDPELSTLAAIEYFKSLYSLFGSWYLSLAAYNAGENKVKSIVMKTQKRDFWEIAHKLPSETANYVPKFLAARLIAKNPQKYGFTSITYEPELKYIKLPIEKPVDLTLMAKHSGIARSVLKSFNPSVLHRYLPVFSDKQQYIKFPIQQAPNSHDFLEIALVKSYVNQNRLYINTPPSYQRYRVRRGETVSHIARKFRTTASAIKHANALNRRYHIRAGQVLKIPRRSSQRFSRNVARASAKKNKKANKNIHVVKRGETLFSISRKYRVSMRRLASINDLKNRSLIHIGKRLVIPD